LRFVDASVLLYPVGTASGKRPKAGIARTLLDHDDTALSVQVRREFYVQATHRQAAFSSKPSPGSLSAR
jgi:hypothetical protein